MPNLDKVRNKVNEYVAKRGISYRELSIRIGHREAYIHQFIKYGLPKRLSEVDRKKIASVLNIEERELVDDELFNHDLPYNNLIKEESFSCLDGEYFGIDIYSVPPQTELYKNVIGRLGLSCKDFSDFGIPERSDLRAFRQVGDSMAPTVVGNAIVVFDAKESFYRCDGIYAVEIDNVVQVKRLQWMGKDRLLLRCDNIKYEDVECKKEDIRIVGRVRFALNPQLFIR